MKTKGLIILAILGFFIGGCSTSYDVKKGECYKFAYEDKHYVVAVVEILPVQNPSTGNSEDAVVLLIGDADKKIVLGQQMVLKAQFEKQVLAATHAKKVSCETLE